jgi:hypothetical protein
MKQLRNVLVGLLLAGIAIVSVNAIESPSGAAEARRQCRWVKGIGVVCDTPLDTIAL